MKLYKLTNSNYQTRNNTQWGEGITHSVTVVPNPQLCSKDVLHAYTSINLALLLNPSHAQLDPDTMCLFEVIGEVVVQDWGKVGCVTLTTINRLQLPIWFTDVQCRIKVCAAFSKLCARAVATESPTWESPTWEAANAAVARATSWAAEAASWAAAAAATKANTERIDFVALADQAVTEVLNEN